MRRRCCARAYADAADIIKARNALKCKKLFSVHVYCGERACVRACVRCVGGACACLRVLARAHTQPQTPTHPRITRSSQDIAAPASPRSQKAPTRCFFTPPSGGKASQDPLSHPRSQRHQRWMDHQRWMGDVSLGKTVSESEDQSSASEMDCRDAAERRDACSSALPVAMAPGA